MSFKIFSRSFDIMERPYNDFILNVLNSIKIYQIVKLLLPHSIDFVGFILQSTKSYLWTIKYFSKEQR